MISWSLSITGSATNYGNVTLRFPVEGGDGLAIERNSIGNYHSGIHPGIPNIPYGSTDLTLVSSVTAEHPVLTFTAEGYGLTDVSVYNGTDSMTFAAYWPEMIDLATCAMPTYYLNDNIEYQVTEASVRLGFARWDSWRGIQQARNEVRGAANRNQNFRAATVRPDVTNGPMVTYWQPYQAMTEMHDGGYSWWSYTGDAYETLDDNKYSRRPVRVDASAIAYAADPFGYADMYDYPGWNKLECARNVMPRLARNGRNLVSVGWDEGWLTDGFSGQHILQASQSASWDVVPFSDGSYGVWVYEPSELNLYVWRPHSVATSVLQTKEAPANLWRLTATQSGSESLAWYVSKDGLHCTGGYLLSANKTLQYGVYPLPQGDYLVAAKWWENVTEWGTDASSWTGIDNVMDAMLLTPQYRLLRTDGKTAKTIESYSDSTNASYWYPTARYHGL